jgi:hypothetical protein
MTFDHSAFEIVGFDGSVPAVHCGTARPFAHLKNTATFYRLSNGDLPGPTSASYNETEVEGLQKAGHVTFLPLPLPVNQGALVLFVSQSFLSAGDIERPSKWHGQMLPWLSMSVRGEAFWFTSATDSVLIHLADSWAQVLMEKSTTILIALLRPIHPAQSADSAERLLRMALHAARHHVLRERVYIRLGLSLLLSERLDSLCDTYRVIQRRYPHWSWDSFLEQVRSFADLLRLRVTLEHSARAHSSGQSIPNHPESPSRVDVVVSQAALVRNIASSEERDRQAQVVASEYKDLFASDSIPVADVKRLARAITGGKDYLPLTDHTLSLLAAEPALYTHKIRFLQSTAGGWDIDVISFLDGLEYCNAQNIPAGRVGSLLIPEVTLP